MFGGGGVIGWQGTPPSWKVLDVNYSQLSESPVDEARSLIPVASVRYPNGEFVGTAHDLVVNSDNEAAKQEFDTIPQDRLDALEERPRPSRIPNVANARWPGRRLHRRRPAAQRDGHVLRGGIGGSEPD
jgi:hypothetical protein